MYSVFIQFSITMQHCTTAYNTHRSAHTQLIKSTLNISTVEAFGGNSAFGTSWDFAAINLPRTTAPVHRPVKHSPFPS